MTSHQEDNTPHAKRDEMNGAPKLWILIEYMSASSPNKMPHKTYEVVDAKEVSGPSGVGNLEMTTGKLIYVKKNSVHVRATIVTISDDKNFLDTELKDLIELQKSEMNQQNPKKRKRLAHIKAESHMNDQSSQYHSWYSRDAMPSASTTQSSVIISNPNVQNHPPMTFDQQTQTDFKPNANEYVPMESRLTKMLMNEESIMRSQQAIVQENQEMKQQMHDFGAQMFEMKSMLTEVLAKMQGLVSEKVEKKTNDEVHSANSVLNFARNSTPNTMTQAPRILNLSQQSLVPQQTYYSTIAIEPIEASNDSSFSASNNSRRSFSASNQSIYHNEINHSLSSLNSSEQAIDLKRDSHKISRSFLDEDGNGDDEIIIGDNQTTVPRSVLMDINWKSHTAATRKLLRAKFSRETLATHSLTGKPSPGKRREKSFPFHCSDSKYFFLFPIALRTQQHLWIHRNQRKINWTPALLLISCHLCRRNAL